jgi:hypothetical protein
MLLTQPLRLPLSTGASPANLALGIGVIGFLGSAPIFLGSVLPNWVALVCGLLIALWFFALCTLPFIAKKRRASDVLVTAQGISIASGPHRGRALGWDEMARKPPVFTPAPKDGDAKLVLPGGIEAVSSEPEEIASLENLSSTLGALASGYAAAHTPDPEDDLDVEVARCPSCGAPITPSHEATTTCRHCSAAAPVPDELRREVDHLRSLASSRTTTARALAVLGRWPRAASVNLVLALAALPLVLGWPAAGVLGSEFFQYRDVFSWRDMGVLFVSTVALTLALVFWLERQVVHRQAFGLVVATFHAVRLESDELGCHNCGAPLAASSDAALIVCAYCRCDNVVLGLDLPPRVRAEARQAAALDVILAERVRSMRTWRWLSVAAVVLLVTGAALLSGPLRRAATVAAPRHPLVDRAWSYPGPAHRE